MDHGAGHADLVRTALYCDHSLLSGSDRTINGYLSARIPPNQSYSVTALTYDGTGNLSDRAHPIEARLSGGQDYIIGNIDGGRGRAVRVLDQV